MLNSPAVYFVCISLVYSLFMNFLFFSKKHIDTYETKIYGVMVVANVIGLTLELISIIGANNFSLDSSIIPLFMAKIFLIYLTAFAFLFTAYVIFVVSLKVSNSSLTENQKLVRGAMFCLFCLASLFICFLPVNIHYENHVMYSYGSGVNVVYVCTTLCAIVCFVTVIFNFKKVNKKKLIPLVVFMLGMGAITLVQRLNPALTLATTMETFLIIIMYHTIENPDVKMIKELEIARDHADKANRAKTDFLSSMSHEIRTPLNAIVGFSDCITDAGSLEEAKENAKDIVNASQTLLEIVNGILDISKIEAGKVEIVNSKYNAMEAFTELARLITPKMNEKGLEFTYTIASDLPDTLYGDHANLRKIVTNLLSNACKYTESGFVHYEVNCVKNNGVCRLIISVEDSGRGIKTSDVDKLFTKFQRIDEDRNTTIEGTGLGLAITKQLVELMGGRIIVHTVYGEGSKFTVVVNQRIEVSDTPVKKRFKTTLDLRNVKILLVDDNLLNLKVGTKLLEKFGANMLDKCDSGFSCIDMVQKGEGYDVILLDDMMPKMSGLQTLNKLKEIPNFNTPVVALTANAISGMREKYLRDGFDEYLAKPIEKEQLIRVMNQILGGSATEEMETIRDKVITVDMKEAPDAKDDKQENLRDDIITVDEVIPVTDLDIDSFNVKEENNVDGNCRDDIILADSDSSCENTEENNVSEYNEEFLVSKGVLVDKALELLGDMDMYNMTIRDFLSELEDKWKNIVDYKDKQDMGNYAILVHSLKSDCKYLGFMNFADILYQHELKSKENDYNFVSTNFELLENEYKKTLAIAREYVDNISLDKGE